MANSRAAEYGKSMSDEEFSTSATPATLSPPARARSALVTVSGGDVRYAFQSTPDANTGHILTDGGNIEIFRDDISAIEIVTASGSPVIFVTYFGD